MKKFLVLLVALSTSVGFQSCNQDDDSFGFSDLIGTYVGAMNVQNPDFTNAQYSVQVSQVSSQVVKITPLGTAGTEWTAHMTNVAGVWTCISCVTNNQVTITEISGSVQLSYNYDNNEQFVGVKQ
ncbi:MAG: hypothetical protein H6603_04720 [Flavobacteriales bacterium]|nr:hypothetical protein [Flavobacteriales bacterium]MCB9191258.1 hypothetical protein [Flavobacteriales bacterium]MCB9204263.1 hypothetical protein [Flavobacteriales bacterium]